MSIDPIDPLAAIRTPDATFIGTGNAIHISFVPSDALALNDILNLVVSLPAAPVPI